MSWGPESCEMANAAAKAERYRLQAEQLTTMAARDENVGTRQALLAIAKTYNEMAVAQDEIDRADRYLGKP